MIPYVGVGVLTLAASGVVIRMNYMRSDLPQPRPQSRSELVAASMGPDGWGVLRIDTYVSSDPGRPAVSMTNSQVFSAHGRFKSIEAARRAQPKGSV